MGISLTDQSSSKPIKVEDVVENVKINKYEVNAERVILDKVDGNVVLRVGDVVVSDYTSLIISVHDNEIGIYIKTYNED